MTIMLSLLLGCAALFQQWRGQRTWVAILLASNLLFIASIGCGIVPMSLMTLTQDTAGRQNVDWGPHNTIVLLGAGTLSSDAASGSRVPIFAYGRLMSTLLAYSACHRKSDDCRIILSGGDPQKHGVSKASVYAEALASAGLTREDLIIEDKSNNTWQNAANASRLVSTDRTLTIVTSGFQLKRSLLYFSHFRPDVRGIAGDQIQVELSALPASINFLVTDALLHEQIGIARFHAYNALGLNAAKAN